MDDKRNKQIPLYLWIQAYKSINNISSDSWYPSKVTGWHTFEEVMMRLVKIYKVKCKSHEEVVKLFEKAIFRYSTAWKWVEDLEVVVEQRALFDKNYKKRLERLVEMRKLWDGLEVRS